jgi:hypothetical protein
MWIVILLVVVGIYLFLKGNSKSKIDNLNSNKFHTNYSRNSDVGVKKNYGKYHRDYSITNLVDKNVALIKEAISNKRKIHFKYRDKEKNLTERSVTPLKLFIHTFGDDGEMLCLEGFCHLRNANRTFALFRMNSLTI